MHFDTIRIPLTAAEADLFTRTAERGLASIRRRLTRDRAPDYAAPGYVPLRDGPLMDDGALVVGHPSCEATLRGLREGAAVGRLESSDAAAIGPSQKSGAVLAGLARRVEAEARAAHWI